MCNLYRLSKGPAEIAKLFRAQADPPGNAGESIYPGYPGYVLAEGRVRLRICGLDQVTIPAVSGMRPRYRSCDREIEMRQARLG